MSVVRRDVPGIHPVPGKCRISHYSVLPGPGKIMGPSNKKEIFFLLFFLLEVVMIQQKDKNYVRSKNFPRKSGLVPGFTTILKCTPECDGIVALHTDGKALQEEISFALISGYR